MITLTAGSRQYGNNKQYIARITGRDSKFTFKREFIGRKDGSTTEANVDEPGLYEECDLDKKGGKDSTYRIIVPHPTDPEKLIKFTAGNHDVDGKGGTEIAMAIAKRLLDAGEEIGEMIECVEQPEDPTKPGEKLYKYHLRGKGESKRASAAVTIDSAVEHCWQALQALPEREAKKVLAALKLRVSPAKPTAHPEEPAPSSQDQPKTEGQA